MNIDGMFAEYVKNTTSLLEWSEEISVVFEPKAPGSRTTLMRGRNLLNRYRVDAKKN